MTTATKKRDFSNYPSRIATPKLTLRIEAALMEQLRQEAAAQNMSLSEIARYYLMQGMTK